MSVETVMLNTNTRAGINSWNFLQLRAITILHQTLIVYFI